MTTWNDAVCPNCGSSDEVYVEADIAGRQFALVWLTIDGSDGPEGDHEYDEHSPAECHACGYEGILKHFTERPRAVSKRNSMRC